MSQNVHFKRIVVRTDLFSLSSLHKGNNQSENMMTGNEKDNQVSSCIHVLGTDNIQIISYEVSYDFP